MKPNTDDAERFLSALDPDARSFTFQTFDDNVQRKDPKLAKVLHGTLVQHAATLASLNEKGAGIFVTVNETDGRGRRAENIVRVRAAFADLDGSPLEPATAYQPAPHVVVETSPGRWHCYWRVTNMPLNKFAGIQKALAAKFDGDASVNDLPRVMRLPGFVHRKAEPFLSRLARTSDDPPCSVADLPTTGGSSAPKPNPKPESQTAAPTSSLPPEITTLLDQHAGEGLSHRPEDNVPPLDPDRVAAALAVIPSDKYRTWFEVGAALRREGMPYAMFSAWSARSTKYDAKQCTKKWDDLANVIGYTAATIFHHANEADSTWRTRVTLPTQEDPQPAPSAAKTKPPALTMIKSAAALQTLTFEPLRWIVPEYLPEGTTVLAGKPKKGKSFWALDVSIAVATGGDCMGKRCEQGDVLALFLEDSDRRLQRRITTMLGAFNENWPERLQYATAWPPLVDGGSKQMRDWIETAAKPRLIVVDILEKVRKRTKGGQTSQYSDDYHALMALHDISTEFQLSILVLHHQRKQGAEDMIDTVSGTLGLAGAADTILILGEDDAGKFLRGRGRDLEEFAVSVQQDVHLRWQALGPKHTSQASPERNQIVAALAKAGRPMSVEEITKAINGVKANVKSLVYKLHRDSVVVKVAHGVYKLPDQQPGLPLGEVDDP
jgi:hypothetical protein